MKNVLQRLRRCELVQWAIAYLAAAWVVIPVVAYTADGYGWPRAAVHIALGLISLGFLVALVVAWYHGERGPQRVSAAERIVLVMVLVAGGALMWRVVHAGVAAPAIPGTGTSARSASRATPPSAASSMLAATDRARRLPLAAHDPAPRALAQVRD